MRNKFLSSSVLALIFILSGKSFAGPKSDSVFELKSNWVRQDSKSVKLKSLQGSYVVLGMFDTNCKDGCSVLISDLKKIETEILKAKRPFVRFALFSFDPKNDTTAKLLKYANEHELDLAHWGLYHSKESAVRELASVLGIKLSRSKTGEFEHSNVITLLDPNGRPIKRLEGLHQDPSSLINEIK